MKSKFKTNKVLSAVKQTGHTSPTSEDRTINQKLATNPFEIQPSKKPDEQRKQTSRSADAERSAKAFAAKLTKD